MKKKNNSLIYHIIFIAVCSAVFYFLLIAPPETTVRLPHNEDHEKFMTMKKKEAEKFCNDCHGQEKVAPLRDDHPPKYRCLFCHKRK